MTARRKPRGIDASLAAQVTVLPTPAQAAEAAAVEFAAAAQDSIAQSGRFLVALAGGNTPREAYQRIAAAHLSQARPVDWAKVHVCFGDERAVPPDDLASNFRMVHESLLSRVPIPEPNVHRIRAELGAATAAEEYERELRALIPGPASKSFDLVLLGLGTDGHTASLFPETTALREQERPVVANWVEKLQQWRITLTLPALNHAGRVVFLVAGKEKATILQQVLSGEPAQQYPAQMIQPVPGSLRWIVDEAAGYLL